METISILSSVVDPKGLNVMLQKRFEFSENSRCELLKTGMNHTYKVETDGSRYIYRIYNYGWRRKEEILEEIRFLDLLKANKLSVSYAIADQSGSKIQVIDAPEGTRYGVLFSFAKGSKPRTLSKEKHKEIGETLGKIHQLSVEMKLDRVNYSLSFLLEESLEKIKNRLSIKSEAFCYLDSKRRDIREKIARSKQTPLRKGIVHLDIWNDNLHISEDGKITIFDFDFCGNGWLALDIAYYIMQLINTEKKITECKANIAAFIKGYESVNVISTEEKELLKPLGMSLYFFYLGVQCDQFERWTNVFLSESYLERYINNIVKRFDEFEF